jgi:hypothetical protein
MIAAISRDPAEPVTQLRDVTWAGKLVEHCIGTLLREADRFVGVNDNEVRHKKALNVSPTNTPEMEALRRRVWQQQGVVSLAIEDITDPWLRQAVQNEAVRRWGPRQQEKNHGR